MVNYGTILYVNNLFASILSLFLNSCLFNCVIRNWTNELRQLNLILIQNIVLDVIYSLCPMTLGVWLSFIDGNIYAFMMGPISHLPHQIGGGLYCFYCMMVCLLVYAFSMQFYFRHRALCSNLKVSLTLQLSLWFLAIVVSLSVGIGLAIAYNFEHDLYNYNRRVFEMVSPYFDITENTPFIVAHTSSLLLKFMFSSAAISLFVSFVLALYYALQISKFVNHTVSLTKRFKQTYLTLHRSLIVQALIFDLAAVIPLIAYCMAVVFELQESQFFFGVCGSTICWTPVINPAVFIYLTKPYRRFLWSKIRRNIRIVGWISTVDTVS